MNENVILMTEKDLSRIRHIISFQSEDFDALETELDRAQVVADKDVPPDLVTMNSKLKFLNIQDNKEVTITIVYPPDANFADGKISVLAPLGSALIGLRVGQEIDWKFPDGKVKRLRILEVLYQPEANEDWHL